MSHQVKTRKCDLKTGALNVEGLGKNVPETIIEHQVEENGHHKLSLSDLEESNAVCEDVL